MSYIANTPARVVSVEHRRAILKAIRDHRDAPRRMLVYCLLRYCGLRASELCSLTVSQVWDGYRSRDKLALAKTQTKGKRSGRTTSLLDKRHRTEHAIEHYIKAERRAGALDPQRALFVTSTGQPLERTGLWRLWQQIQLSAGIPNSETYTVHDLRHTWATAAEAESDGDLTLVQQALGHRSQTTTMHYIHRDLDRLHAVNARMDV